MKTFGLHRVLWGMHILPPNQLDRTMNHPIQLPVDRREFWVNHVIETEIGELNTQTEHTFDPSHLSRIFTSSLLALSCNNEIFARNPYKCGNIMRFLVNQKNEVNELINNRKKTPSKKIHTNIMIACVCLTDMSIDRSRASPFVFIYQEYQLLISEWNLTILIVPLHAH